MTTKIQILSNTNYSLINVLKSELMESTEIKIAVAFARKTGIEEIYKALDYALTINQAKIEVIVGLDFKTTDSTALFALKEIEEKYSGFNFYCFGDKRDNYSDLIFHPKIYLFETSLSKNTKYSSIIGSSNLTRGGLTSNLEVNSIFREDKPIYYSQLEAIYNEIRNTDSVFKPSKEYILKYGNVKKEIEKSNSLIDKKIQHEIKELIKDEQYLQGTIPTIKRILIDIIKMKNTEGLDEVPLETLYKETEFIIKQNNYKFNIDTLKNTIRGELNKHEQQSTHPDNMQLFIRSNKQRGYYSLTTQALQYKGR